MTPEELLKRYELAPSKDDELIEYELQLWQDRYSPCGRFLIGCGYDATIQRWDISGEKPQLMPELTGHNGWVQAIGFQPQKNRLLSADSWGQLACWSYAEQATKPVWSLPEAHPNWIRAIAISPNGELVATGGNSNSVRIWSTEDGKLQREIPHPDRIFSLCFHPKGNALVVGDLKGIIRQWDTSTEAGSQSGDDAKEVRQFDAAILFNDEAETKGRIQQCGGIRHLQFDAGGKRLVCTGQKQPGGGFATGTPCAIVYDWESGKQIREMPMGGAQDGFSYDAQFHPDGFVMATSTAFPGKGHVWFWRPEDEKAFFTSSKLPNGFSLSLHPNGNNVAHLTSKSPNGNGRALKDGEYVGGSARIRLLHFPIEVDA
jgi:hypothetical protein